MIELSVQPLNYDIFCLFSVGIMSAEHAEHAEKKRGEEVRKREEEGESAKNQDFSP